jgi:hypothetical protein
LLALIRYSRVCCSLIEVAANKKDATELRVSVPVGKVEVATMTWLHLTVMEYVLQMICSTSRKHFLILSSFTTNHQICNYNYIYMSGATSGVGTAYPSCAHDFTPGFQWGSCYSIFSFMCMFCISLWRLPCFLHNTEDTVKAVP